MLRTFTVEKQTLALLKQLQQLPLLQNTRLAGGTALALQLGHRNSSDLDFFGEFHATHMDFIDAFNNESLTFSSLQNTKSIHVFDINTAVITLKQREQPYTAQPENLEKAFAYLERHISKNTITEPVELSKREIYI